MKKSSPGMLFLSVCILLRYSPAFVPHTEPYQPCSEWEIEEYRKANVYVFPDDIRDSLYKYKATVIAWPGIIQSHNFTPCEDRVDLELIVEHHYYDWLEDFSIQREKIFLSPRGEGLFYAIWPLKKDVDIEEFDKHDLNGDLVIVYGYPDTIFSDSTIMIRSTYIRSFPENYFRTDIMDYGRVYEPVEKILKPRQSHNFGEMCCMGCIGVAGFGAIASLSFLDFGDEILGAYWMCGALTIGGGMFSTDTWAPGPSLAIPMALGLGALSYYDFAYGDEHSDTELFYVNALAPWGIAFVAAVSAAIFPSCAFKESKKVSLLTQQNGFKISVRF